MKEWFYHNGHVLIDHYSSSSSVTSAVTILAAAVTKRPEKRSGTYCKKSSFVTKFGKKVPDKLAFNIDI